jgi:hypothetical protein
MATFLLLLGLVTLGVLVLRLSRRVNRLERELQDLATLRSPAVHPRSVAEQAPAGPRATPVDPAPAIRPIASPSPAGPALAVPPPLPLGAGASPVKHPPKAAEGTASPAAPLPPPIPAAPVAPLPPRPEGSMAGSWPSRLTGMDWEQFFGVKLFAWLGGLALFLAAAFFLKYSFEHDLIPPVVRATLGYATAVGLVAGGWQLSRRQFAATGQSLIGSGIVLLYAVTFACRSYYHFAFFGVFTTFLLLVAITVGAFFLAVRQHAPVVAVLGLLGGFLTPGLLSTGEDNALGLFSYLGCLNVGLFSVVWKRRWTYLTPLAALATLAVQAVWASRFLNPDTLPILVTVQPCTVVLFGALLVLADRGGWRDRYLLGALLVVAGGWLPSGFTSATGPLGNHPVALFCLWFLVDAVLVAVALSIRGLRWLESSAGVSHFLLLAVWTLSHSQPEFFYPALAAYLAFALLHTGAPALRQRLSPADGPGLMGQLFPTFALSLFVLPLLSHRGVLPAGYWGGVLVVAMLALLLAGLAGGILALIGVLLLSLMIVGLAVAQGGALALPWNEALILISGFAAVFLAGGFWLVRRHPRLGFAVPPGQSTLGFQADPRLAISGAGTVLPFLLLNLLILRAREPHLGSVFGLTAGLTLLALGLARLTRTPGLAGFALVGASLVQWTWVQRPFAPDLAGYALGWHLAFWAAFTVTPFLEPRQDSPRRLPWAIGAFAAFPHFLLVLFAAGRLWPADWHGLIPAAFALPTLLILGWQARQWPPGTPHRLTVLSIQGGVGLAFVTLIFPLQFHREWLTLGWALEGAALLWLFRRLPHDGLRLTGLALLGIAFVRLIPNPILFGYHERTGVLIWNWYLYAYLTVASACFFGAQAIRIPDAKLGPIHLPGVLRGLGTLLLFFLLNLEIADAFGTGPTLTFEFDGNFARDLSYTIGWSLFALALVVIGIAKSSRITRYCGLGLLGVTILKLFLHDLARLHQLHRIGAFAAVAVVAILASLLYQRFLNRPHPFPSLDESKSGSPSDH